MSRQCSPPTPREMDCLTHYIYATCVMLHLCSSLLLGQFCGKSDRGIDRAHGYFETSSSPTSGVFLSPPRASLLIRPLIAPTALR